MKFYYIFLILISSFSFSSEVGELLSKLLEKKIHEIVEFENSKSYDLLFEKILSELSRKEKKRISSHDEQMKQQNNDMRKLLSELTEKVESIEEKSSIKLLEERFLQYCQQLKNQNNETRKLVVSLTNRVNTLEQLLQQESSKKNDQDLNELVKASSFDNFEKETREDLHNMQKKIEFLSVVFMTHTQQLISLTKEQDKLIEIVGNLEKREDTSSSSSLDDLSSSKKQASRTMSPLEDEQSQNDLIITKD